MQYTIKSSVLFAFLEAYVPEEQDPEENVTDIFLYVQDSTTAIDFYILQYSSQYGDMLALVDPIFDPLVLDLELVNIDSLDTHRLFIKVFKKKSPLNLEAIKNHILPTKYLIPVRK